MQQVTGYEVRIGGNGLPPTGTIIPYEDIPPRKAQVLVDHRRLRPLTVRGYGAIAEERQRWRTALEPYAIASADAAPKGSELARLVQEAAASEKVAVAAEKRAATLAAQLAKAQGVINSADEHADFGTIADALAEMHVVGTIARDAEREAAKARTTATEAAAAVAKAWQGVTNARAAIERSISGDLLDKNGTIWWSAWKTLRDLLDVPVEAA